MAVISVTIKKEQCSPKEFSSFENSKGFKGLVFSAKTECFTTVYIYIYEPRIGPVLGTLGTGY